MGGGKSFIYHIKGISIIISSSIIFFQVLLGGWQLGGEWLWAVQASSKVKW